MPIAPIVLFTNFDVSVLVLVLVLQAVIEVLVGYAIVIVGVLASAGSFVPIRSTEQIASRCVVCSSPCTLLVVSGC
jgi:hypothetical protein